MKHRNQQITFLHILSYFCIDNTDHNIFYDIIRINLYFFFIANYQVQLTINLVSKKKMTPTRRNVLPKSFRYRQKIKRHPQNLKTFCRLLNSYHYKLLHTLVR